MKLPECDSILLSIYIMCMYNVYYFTLDKKPLHFNVNSTYKFEYCEK